MSGRPPGEDLRERLDRLERVRVERHAVLRDVLDEVSRLDAELDGLLASARAAAATPLEGAVSVRNEVAGVLRERMRRIEDADRRLAAAEAAIEQARTRLQHAQARAARLRATVDGMRGSLRGSSR